MKRAGSSKLLKKLNRLQSLDCIKRSDTIFKAGIKNITKLTAISEITGKKPRNPITDSVSRLFFDIKYLEDKLYPQA